MRNWQYKQKRESNTVTKFREALSFLLYMRVIFFAFAKSDISLAGSDIVRLRLTVIFYSPKSSQRSHGERANITRRKPNITAYTMQLCAISLAAGE